VIVIIKARKVFYELLIQLIGILQIVYVCRV